MIAVGQIDRLKKSDLPSKPVCLNRNTVLAGLFDLATAYIMLILGMSAAVLVMCVEVIGKSRPTS